MPYAALVCRLTAWFVLGAGAAGAAFFLRYDGLGVAIAVFLVVLAAAAAVMLWALGRVCAETARLARRLAPPPAAESRGWFGRRPAAPVAAPAPLPAAAPSSTRPMTPDELDEFFGRPSSLAAHRAAGRGARPSDRG